MTSPPRYILIIDDDNRNIFALSAVLRAKGYQTLSAPDMKEAFALLDKGTSVDAILLDMMMPDMDGYEALPLLKSNAQWAAIPVIAVTAQAMKGDRERCLAAGANDYLSKPVDVDQLLKMLNGYLNK